MREYYAWERKINTVNEIAAMNLIDILIGRWRGNARATVQKFRGSVWFQF